MKPDCKNCRYWNLTVKDYPCNICVTEPDYDRFWMPKRHKPIVFGGTCYGKPQIPQYRVRVKRNGISEKR